MNPVMRRAAVAQGMTERDLMENVIELMQRLGWRRPYHTKDSRKSEPGFPDLVSFRPAKDGRRGRVVYIELKTDAGKTTAAQDEWIDGLQNSGAEAYVFRPEDWMAGRIDRVLA